PSHLCHYLHQLGQTYNRFYEQCHILKETNPSQQASWISLSDATLKTITIILSLLGIEVPERM
ncbi:MAG: DALR anticodon-binding domain-containing protein, partial [Chloroflexota bacterium]